MPQIRVADLPTRKQRAAGNSGTRAAVIIHPPDRPERHLLHFWQRIGCGFRSLGAFLSSLVFLVYSVWVIQKSKQIKGIKRHRPETECRPRAFVAANRLVWVGVVAGLAPERGRDGVPFLVGTPPRSAEIPVAAAVLAIKARRTSGTPV
jgi:hypothetical protein